MRIADTLPNLAGPRLSLWAEIIRAFNVKTIAEIGVWKGEFAESILRSCPCVHRPMADAIPDA